MLTTEFKTMGCRARAVLDSDGARARAAFDRLPAWFAERERTLSRFDAGSALARLNARGSAEHVDEVLRTAIDVALSAAEATGGLVTPAILPALEAAGYDRTFDELQRDQLGTARSAGGPRLANHRTRSDDAVGPAPSRCPSRSRRHGQGLVR